LQGYDSSTAEQAMTFLSFEDEIVQEKQNLFKAALKAANSFKDVSLPIKKNCDWPLKRP
jgi:hypothetical protein